MQKANLLWGGRGIGGYLGLTPRRVYDLYEAGKLTGITKIGGTLVSTPERLMANFNKDTKTEPETDNE